MFIYLTTNLISNKKYIGMCTRDDDNYLGSGKHLKYAIKKYGKENFKREILQICTNIKELCEAEAYWINKYNAVESKDFYNINCGGLGGNSELLKEYWSNMSKSQRKIARNWNGYFCNNVASREVVYDNPNWRDSVSRGVAASWANLTNEERETRNRSIKLGIAEKRDFTGNKNPMAGRSAIKEKNLKWYTNGITTIYVAEGTQPEGFYRGRKFKNKK